MWPADSRYFAALALTATGCRPLLVAADANVSLPQPLAVVGEAKVTGDAKVSASMNISPVTDQSPITPSVVLCEPAGQHLPRVAILDVDGLLLNSDMVGLGSHGENPVSLFRERLDAVAADPQVVAVVLRINSPGGGVTATDIMWHDLRSFKKQTQLPILACLLDAGAGGAYYLATAADQIVVHPTSIVGGIGVILNLYNLQDTMSQFNIAAEPIRAGKRIDLGSPVAALDDEGRQTAAIDGRFLPAAIPADRARSSRQGRRQRRDQFRRPGVHRAGRSTPWPGRPYRLSERCDRRSRADRRLPEGECRFLPSAQRSRQSLYASTPNVPLQGGLLPLSLPGLDRSRMPTFLYLWQLDPTLEKLGGK